MLGLTFTSPHHGSLSPARPQTPLRFQSARSLDQRTQWSSIGPFAFSWPIDLIAAAAEFYVRITWKLHTMQRFARPMMMSSAYRYFRR
ncbi:hypothetical protein CCHR01_03195 [Colletotrichum chrysophilum]|uniref:Uncharacterized protein n=1 Tax=Colletotrichum chrysophilum TaxID=1836956 RepID=A0AAD9ERN5_9PEZI|nr:hypothetical protein CCHR01_03195 [Colletotrichum chrysophilum]